MARKAHGLRLPEDLEMEMERERARRGDPPFSVLATSLLREALRNRLKSLTSGPNASPSGASSPRR